LENKKSQLVILLLIGILLVVIALPTSSNQENSIKSDSREWTTTEMESRLEKILEQMRGVGEVCVMITYQEEAKVEGVVVVADGAKQPIIVQKITEVVRALFDVDSHNIKVIESK
jgi:stage III sporulation protein AG